MTQLRIWGEKNAGMEQPSQNHVLSLWGPEGAKESPHIDLSSPESLNTETFSIKYRILLQGPFLIHLDSMNVKCKVNYVLDASKANHLDSKGNRNHLRQENISTFFYKCHSNN